MLFNMVFIIAELGTNHKGDTKIVKEMITIAKSVGCDAVKLQKKNNWVDNLSVELYKNEVVIFIRNNS